MRGRAANPELPVGFIVATFVVAGLVAAAIIYFGLRGSLGGPIP